LRWSSEGSLNAAGNSSQRALATFQQWPWVIRAHKGRSGQLGQDYNHSSPLPDKRPGETPLAPKKAKDDLRKTPGTVIVPCPYAHGPQL
jgi:hypothetical protein